MNEIRRDDKSLVNLAEHLAAMLDHKQYMNNLEDEMDTLTIDLEDLRIVHIGVGDEKWEPRKKPSGEWTEEDISYLTLDNRLEAVRLVREALEMECGFAWKEHTMTPVILRLRVILLNALESWEDLACPYELSNVEELKMKGCRCLGPKRLPPPIQALQLQEERLLEILDYGDMDPRLRRMVKNQYDTIWQLKGFLISELFKTRDDILSKNEKQLFLMSQDWKLWVVYD